MCTSSLDFTAVNLPVHQFPPAYWSFVSVCETSPFGKMRQTLCGYSDITMGFFSFLLWQELATADQFAQI